MKKRLLFLIIFLFIFGCNSYLTGKVVQQTTSNEYRTVLVNSIVNYLTSPNNAILNVNEIKDLLFGYFLTHNNIIDLSIIGTYSHESLVDIYNKAKGTNIPGEKGEWYDIMQSSYKMDKNVQIMQPNGILAPAGQGFGYGCHPTPGICYPDMVSIQPEQTLYFLIDPYKYWEVYGSVKNNPRLKYFSVLIIDYNLHHTQDYYETTVINIDRNGNELPEQPGNYFMSAGNGVYQGYVGIFNHTDEKVHIIKIKALKESGLLRINWPSV